MARGASCGCARDARCGAFRLLTPDRELGQKAEIMSSRTMLSCMSVRWGALVLTLLMASACNSSGGGTKSYDGSFFGDGGAWTVSDAGRTVTPTSDASPGDAATD